MLNLKREIFAATERTFRFAMLNASFENARTFRFADYTFENVLVRYLYVIVPLAKLTIKVNNTK